MNVTISCVYNVVLTERVGLYVAVKGEPCYCKIAAIQYVLGI